MPKQLTLEEIGKMAGVSRATVSRVVNNYPHISPEVRERVQRVIDRTGYQPNLAARTLASSKSRIVGLLIPHFMQDTVVDPYYSVLQQGIAEACHTSDYTLATFLLHTTEEDLTLQRIIGTGFVDGLMITLDPTDGPMLQQLLRRDLPLVYIGRPRQPDAVSYVDIDNVRGAYLATAHLIQQGYTKIAFIGRGVNTTCEDRLQGYRQALLEHGLAWDDTLVIEGDFSVNSGYEGMKKLLPLRPEAVFAVNDRSAIGAMNAVQDAGLRVPEDIALVGFDDINISETVTPALTTIRQPIKESGRIAAETLVSILEDGVKPVQHVLPVELIIRKSCGAAL